MNKIEAFRLAKQIRAEMAGRPNVHVKVHKGSPTIVHVYWSGGRTASFYGGRASERHCEAVDSPETWEKISKKQIQADREKWECPVCKRRDCDLWSRLRRASFTLDERKEFARKYHR